LIIILCACYAQTLQNSQSFGLFATKGEPLELLKLETKATTEGPYVEIQYAFLYKNPSQTTIQAKFVFPPTMNAVFHKFEATIQNQTISAKVVENPANQIQSPQGINDSDLDSDLSDDFLNIPAQETMHIIFAMSQPLNHLFNILYELKLPAFINDSIPGLESCHFQIELRSHDPFVVLSNPSHELIPHTSEEHANSQTIYKAVWNATITPDKDFIVYFGPENLQKPQFILAAHPRDPQDHVLLLNSIPEGRLTAQDAQKIFENYTNDTMIKLMRIAFSMLMMDEPSCLFIIDRSDSMKGAKIESLKQKLKQLVEYSPYCDDYSFLSFGSSFELHKIETRRYANRNDIYEWIDTIKADMGGSDLLKALKYLFDNEQDYSYPTIILTDGDISHPDQVIKYLKSISAIVAIGDETSDDIIKYLARADGGQIDFVLANEGLERKIFNLLQENHSSDEFSYGYSVKCWDSQNQVVYKEKKMMYYDFYDQQELFREWFYLSNLINMETCDIKIEGSDECDGDLFDKAKISKAHLIEGTDIWHKVAYDAKIKQLQKKFQYLIPQEQKAIQEQILHLALRYQILSPFTSLVLPTTSSSSTNFFDLSKFNKPPSKTPVDLSNFVVPKNYIPLDSVQSAGGPRGPTAA